MYTEKQYYMYVNTHVMYTAECSPRVLNLYYKDTCLCGLSLRDCHTFLDSRNTLFILYNVPTYLLAYKNLIYFYKQCSKRERSILKTSAAILCDAQYNYTDALIYVYVCIKTCFSTCHQ